MPLQVGKPLCLVVGPMLLWGMWCIEPQQLHGCHFGQGQREGGEEVGEDWVAGPMDHLCVAVP